MTTEIWILAIVCPSHGDIVGVTRLRDENFFVFSGIPTNYRVEIWKQTGRQRDIERERQRDRETEKE